MQHTEQLGIPLKGWIREADLLRSRAIPFKRTKLREEVTAGRFPKPKGFTARVVAYNCEAIHEWIRAQETEAPDVPTGPAAPAHQQRAATAAAA